MIFSCSARLFVVLSNLKLLLAFSFDFSGFDPCGIHLSIKNSSEYYYNDNIFHEVYKTPVEIFARSPNIKFLKPYDAIFPRLRIGCFLMVFVFEAKEDGSHFQWDTKVFWSLRVTTKIFVYFSSSSNSHCSKSKTVSATDQHSTFVLLVHVKPKKTITWLFCCPLCATRQLYVTRFKDKMLLNMFNVRDFWEHPLPEYGICTEGIRNSVKPKRFCLRWSLFDTRECSWSQTISDSVYEASQLSFRRGNLSIAYGLKTFVSCRLGDMTKETNDFSLVFEFDHHPQIIYCDYGPMIDLKDSSIWLRQITSTNAALIVLSCFVCAAVVTHNDKTNKVLTVRLLLGKYLVNLGLITSLFVSQGSYHKRVGLVLLLQISSVFVILTYRSSLMLSNEPPIKDVRFINITQLLQANYTLLFYAVNKNHAIPSEVWSMYKLSRRPLHFTSKCCQNYDLVDGFHDKKQEHGLRYALYDYHLEKQFLTQRLAILVGYKYKCHSISPPEKGFGTQSYFTAYKSPVGNILAQTHRRLLSVGFHIAIGRWIKYDTVESLKKPWLKRAMRKGDKNWKDISDGPSKQPFHSRIVLENLKPPVSLVVATSIMFILIFIFEVFLKQKMRLYAFLGKAYNTANEKFQKIWLVKNQSR